jgi:adenylyltransferase/sulfurtransferase
MVDRPQPGSTPRVTASNGGLSRDELRRYSRHLLIPEVGSSGQERLKRSKALVVGAGGLGSPVAMYLAAAGVGTIGIVDDDVVEGSNLQRQVIHSTETIGQPKAESARDFIKRLNPDIDVKVYAFRLNETNVHEIIADYDVIVDGTDNFDTRYIVNDAAVELRKPVVHGSIFRFEGMASTFVPFEGPCYRCLYPEAPPPELAPT